MKKYKVTLYWIIGVFY